MGLEQKAQGDIAAAAMCLQKACDLAHSHLEGTAPEALSTLNETCAELRLVRALCPH
jgi:hypothetical protein